MADDTLLHIPYRLTPAQVDTLDGTPVTLFTFPTASEVVRVPRYLKLYLEAGDAYTLGGDCRLEVYDNQGNIWFGMPMIGLLDQSTAKQAVGLPQENAFRASQTSVSVRIIGSIAKGTASGNLRLHVVYSEIVARFRTGAEIGA